MDLSMVKSRLKNLQSSSGQKSNLWKPSPGKQVVRIVPYKFDKEMPFIELYFHYGINGKSILSPISFGKPDPIQEFGDKLKLSGNRDDFQLGRKLTPKLRTYAPLVVRGEESEGVRFWGFGKLVYQELLSIVSDPDYGDISDISNGRDVVIEFKTAEELGTSFPKTTIRVKPNQTPLYDDKKIVDGWLDKQLSIQEIFKHYSYEDMQEIMNKWLNDVPSEPQDEEPSVSVQSETTIDGAFNELFSD